MKSTSGQKFHLDAPPGQPVMSSCHLADASSQLVIASGHLVVS